MDLEIPEGYCSCRLEFLQEKLSESIAGYANSDYADERRSLTSYIFTHSVNVIM